MQIIDISTLEFHISTTPNDTQSSKITRIYHDRIRSIDGNRILCQFFESYLLHINIIYNTFHFGCQIQLHISCNHSHIFRLFKLLWKINQRIVQMIFNVSPITVIFRYSFTFSEQENVFFSPFEGKTPKREFASQIPRSSVFISV